MNKRWTEKRCARKAGSLVAPLQQYVRKHGRRTIGLGVAFAFSAALVTPFFAGMPWHHYWGSIGSALLLACLISFIAFVCEAGWTFVHWSTLRDWRRSEKEYLANTRHVDPGDSSLGHS
jgi:fatty acid desaturase